MYALKNDLGNGNYLRVRGEYTIVRSIPLQAPELPPRTRRIPFPAKNGMSLFGTTSAYAENTLPISVFKRFIWNYLRVRGEYEAATAFGREAVELPPRTRRILYFSCSAFVVIGTTSAYAENTGIAFVIADSVGNYLRVRGEYRFHILSLGALFELPPRTRRIHMFGHGLGGIQGTTSAYAENT